MAGAAERILRPRPDAFLGIGNLDASSSLIVSGGMESTTEAFRG